MKDLPAALDLLGDPSPRTTRFRTTLTPEHIRTYANSVVNIRRTRAVGVRRWRDEKLSLMVCLPHPVFRPLAQLCLVADSLLLPPPNRLWGGRGGGSERRWNRHRT